MSSHFSFPTPGMPQQKGPFCTYYALQTIANDQRNEKLDEIINLYQRRILAADDKFKEAPEQKLLYRYEFHKMFISDLNIGNVTDTARDNLARESDPTSLEAHQKVFERIAYQAAIFTYGFEYSTWFPTHSITNLIHELQTNGPLLVSGFFGRCFYKNNPTLRTEKIEKRPIYKWKEKRRDYVPCEDTHTVVLVGAKKEEEQSFVYYLDPHDGSQANTPSSQKVYECTYETFVNSIATCCGRADPSLALEDNAAYAQYLPKAP